MSKGDWLGEFELCVMLAVGQLVDHKQPAYGVRVRQLIERHTGRSVTIGAVYTTLGRLEDKGFVQFQLGESQPVAGGRARKCFALTAAGTTMLTQSTSMLGRMMLGWRPLRAR